MAQEPTLRNQLWGLGVGACLLLWQKWGGKDGYPGVEDGSAGRRWEPLSPLNLTQEWKTGKRPPSGQK